MSTTGQAAWIRWPARVVRGLGWGVLFVAMLLLVSRVSLGDRWLWSQWVAYLPLPGVIAMAWCGSGVAWAAGRVLGRDQRRGGRVVLGGLLLASAYLGIAEWHLPRALMPEEHLPDAERVRVLTWNPAWQQMSGFDVRVTEHHPDVFVAATPHYTADFSALRSEMGPVTSAVRSPTFAVVSVFPVVRWGWTALNIQPEPNRPGWLPKGLVSSSGGEAAFVELDTTAKLGHTTVVWCLDLPSDPFLHRPRAIREAIEAIRAFRGPAQRRSTDGGDVPEPIEGFPMPDLVVGDFNTPRGAPALRLLPGSLTDAYDQAGWGPSGTYPRWLPVLHIDHQLVGPRLRAVSHDVLDLGAGRHAAVLVEFTAATKGER